MFTQDLVPAKSKCIVAGHGNVSPNPSVSAQIVNLANISHDFEEYHHHDYILYVLNLLGKLSL